MSTTRTDHGPDVTGAPCDAFGETPKTIVTVLDRGRDGSDDAVGGQGQVLNRDRA